MLMAGTRYERVSVREDDGQSVAVEMDHLDSGGITLTLRGVGIDERRLVVAPTCTVAQLKAQAYGEALREGHSVRFIHFGKLLRDQDTLEQAGVQHGAFLHVAVGPKSSSLSSRIDVPAAGASSRESDEPDDEEHTEESDRQFALRLAREAGGDLDDAQHIQIHEGRFLQIPEGSSRDFVWGFLMGFVFTWVALMWIWQPRVPRRQRAGILCGVLLSMLFGMTSNEKRSSQNPHRPPSNQHDPSSQGNPLAPPDGHA